MRAAHLSADVGARIPATDFLRTARRDASAIERAGFSALEWDVVTVGPPPPGVPRADAHGPGPGDGR